MHDLFCAGRAWESGLTACAVVGSVLAVAKLNLEVLQEAKLLHQVISNHSCLFGTEKTYVTKHSMCSQVRIGQQVPYSIIIKCSTVIQDGMIIRPSVLEGELDSYLVAELQ